MNGVHDMGGMQGMGPVQHEQNEPVFHSAWEGRIYAINRALGAWRKWNIDAGRHQIELIPPADYLRMSYYEKWLTRNIELLVKVLDGCARNGKVWVFASATTNVGFTMTVTDTVHHATRTYTNTLGKAAPPIQDTTAFAGCQ